MEWNRQRIINILHMELKRCIVSPRFGIMVLAVSFVCILGCMDTVLAAIKYSKVSFSSAYELERLLTFDRYKSVLIALLAAIYAGSYAKDKNSRYLQVILSRVTVKEYVICRIAAAAIGVITATVLGFLLMILLLRPVMSIQSISGSVVADKFLFLIKGGGAVLYVILLGINFGMAAAVLTVFGLWISVWKTDEFVAVGGSVLVFYFIYSISLLLPGALSFEIISSRFNVPVFLNAGATIMYHIIYLSGWLLFAGAGFYRAVRVRWNNGLLA